MKSASKITKMTTSTKNVKASPTKGKVAAKQKRSKKAASATNIAEEKNKYEESLKSFIDFIDIKMHDMKEAGSEATAEAKVQVEEQLKNLGERRDELASKLKKLGESGEEKWEEIKKETSEHFEKTKNEMGDLFDGVKAGFKHLMGKFK